MIVQYCSDLHLEFPENRKFIKENPIQQKGDILILAGDVIPFHHLPDVDWFFDTVSETFDQVYWIPGNHEYYHSNILDWVGPIDQPIRDNVQLIDNKSIDCSGVGLFFSTLWSKISDKKRWQIREMVNDFRLIKENGHPLSVNRFNDLHNESIAYLSKQKAMTMGNSVIITHHVPTMINYPKQYIGSEINEVFVTELEEFILDCNPSYWIYGHHHVNVPAFTIGKTKLLTNQLGYVHRLENKGYGDSIIEI